MKYNDEHEKLVWLKSNFDLGIYQNYMWKCGTSIYKMHYQFILLQIVEYDSISFTL